MKTQTYVKSCPECGGKSTVADCRTQPNGILRRRRKCTKCGFTWDTVELEESISDFSTLVSENARLKKEINTLRSELRYIGSYADKVLRR